jgi:hypothetical protein
VSRFAVLIWFGALAGCALQPPGLLASDCAVDGDCPDGLVCLEKVCVEPVIEDAGPVDAPVAPPDWHDLDYGARVRVDVDNGGITTRLLGVPLLVRVDGGNPALGDVNAGTVVFYSDDGDVLPHEVETVNAGGARLWVRPDFVGVGGEDAGFWLYFDGPGQDAAPSDVWQDHVTVWHFGEPVGDRLFTDSVGDVFLADLNVQPQDQDLFTTIGIGAGAAVRYDGSAYVSGGRDIAYHARAGQQRTYSVWALRTGGGDPVLLQKEIRDDTCFGPYLKIVNQDTVRAGYRAGFCNDEEGDPFVDAANPVDDNWHLYALVVNQQIGTLSFFIDGVSQGSIAVPEPDTGDPQDALLTIGSREGANTWVGNIDEVRISERVATADELAFRFRTEFPGSPAGAVVERRDP